MSKTHEQFFEEIKKINPSIELISRYTKATETVSARCKVCGYVWSPKAYYLTQGRGCPKCGTERGALNNKGLTHRKTTSEFINQLADVDADITVLGEYQNTHTSIECKCKICGSRWQAKPYSLLQGHGCPRCAKSGTSFMEQFIKTSFERALGDKMVLSRDKRLIGLELDIVIPSRNIAFEPGNWFLHRRNLKRDFEKRNRCEDKGIRLITIYDKYPVNLDPPFSSDCITFPFDLNKADREIIKQLVYDLFDLASVQKIFSIQEWNEIETYAYKNAKAKTHSAFLEEMKKVHPFIQVLGVYQNSNKPVRVKCEKCGFEWNGIPANMLAGDGCRKCGARKAHERMIRNPFDFIKEMGKVNASIEVIGQYIGRHQPVRVKCKICGYEWDACASSLLRGSSHKGSKTLHNNLKQNN